MANYRYTATDGQGLVVTGELAADDVRAAVDQLLADGHVLQSIELLEPAKAETVGASSTSALTTIVARVLSGNEPLAAALDAYHAELPASGHRNGVAQLAGLVRRGDVDAAVASYPRLARHWSPMFGRTSETVNPRELAAAYFRRVRSDDSTLPSNWATLIYPAVLLLLVLAVMVAMSLIVIPTFEEIFDTFELELPALTKAILSTARTLRDPQFYIVVAGVLFALYACWTFRRFLPLSLRRYFARRVLWRWRRWFYVEQLAERSADLLAAGLPSSESLELASTSVENLAIQGSAAKAAAVLRLPLKTREDLDCRVLTHRLAFACVSNLKPAAEVHLLRELSHDCHERHNAAWSGRHGYFTALAVVLIGSLIGICVVGLFLPLVRITTSLS